MIGIDEIDEEEYFKARTREALIKTYKHFTVEQLKDKQVEQNRMLANCEVALKILKIDLEVINEILCSMGQ